MTWRGLLRRAEQAVGANDARRIVERVFGYDGAEMWAQLDQEAPARAVAQLEALVQRRARGEPLQYVVRGWGFRRLDLFVDRRVLIPRPETETVVEVAIGELAELAQLDELAEPGPPRRHRRRTVVDLGTGSGAIGLSLAAEVTKVSVWATDISPDALAVARANIAGLGSPAGARVRLAQGDWWDALPSELEGQVDLVVSNPPYISTEEALPPEVAEWEPASALIAGPTGLEALEVVISGAARWLARPGRLVVEVAPHQAEEARGMAAAAGFRQVEVRSDLNGRARVLVARV